MIDHGIKTQTRDPVDNWADLLDPLYVSIKLYIYTWIVCLFAYMNYPLYAIFGIYGSLFPTDSEWLFLESTTMDDHESSWNFIKNWFMREW